MRGTLTPLGHRTLEGYIKRYGSQGEQRFDAALESGVLQRSRMEHANTEQGGRKTVPAFVLHPKGLEADDEQKDVRNPQMLTEGEKFGDPKSAAPLRPPINPDRYKKAKRF